MRLWREWRDYRFSSFSRGILFGCSDGKSCEKSGLNLLLVFEVYTFLCSAHQEIESEFVNEIM